MFGYVRPFKSELLVKEYEQYKAVYCSLCKELGKHFGILTRFSLNYDLCFYTMLALNYSQGCPKLENGRCTFNPAKKCNYLSLGDSAYKKAAALTVLMTYHKILDNIKDESFSKALVSRIMLPVFHFPAKKASEQYTHLSDVLKTMTESQNLIEQDENASIDACSDPTARAMAEIFKDINEKDSVVLEQFGYFLGRWVYIMDASDDLKDDMKNGSFNPLISYMKKSGIDINDSKKVEEECNQILNYNVSMIVPAFNLLKEGIYTNIIDNVVTKGFPQIQKEILFLHVRDKERKKINDRSV
ncbi:MAG: DUF5685 family protein [Clostridia bacterium]